MPAAALSGAAARLGSRLAGAAAAVQRVRTLAVPVEAVPSGWRPVPVMVAAAAHVDAEIAAVVAVAAPAAAATPPARTRGARGATGSIKSSPPKAPRTRAASKPVAAAVAVAVLDRPVVPSSPEVPIVPADAVPVMVPSAAIGGATEAVPPVDVADPPVDVADPPVDAAAGLADASAASDAPTQRVELPPVVVAVPIAWVPDKPRVIDPGHSPGVERASSTLAQRIGDDAERLAAFRLEALGWRIVARNLRLSRTEIDLLAIDPSSPPHLVIVEVRRRTRRDFGLAEETVDFRKRAALRRAAGELAMRPALPDGRRLPNLPVRVDLVAIDRGPDGRPSLRHHRGIEL